jgi:hypothetical protein
LIPDRFQALRWPLFLTFALSGAAVAARAGLGSFRFLIAVRSPLVGEGVCALAVTLLLLMRHGSVPAPAKYLPLCPPAGILAMTAACLSAVLWFPLVCDEYVLAAQARGMGWAEARAFFTRPSADRFFRPLADLSLRLDTLWAGADPFGWHALSLVLHLLNTTLVWRLIRRRTNPAVAFWAAALFGIHGSRPESVAFLARFDQLATLFVLAALLLLDRYLESNNALTFLAANAAMLAGLLSKESAYIFPLLAVWLLAWRGRLRQWRSTLGFFAVTAVVFVYRWILLGGIGGYPDRATGRPAILNIRPLALLKGLTLRLWGLLYFPINWSDQPEAWLTATLVPALIALAALVLYTRADRRLSGYAVLFTLLASLPVAHMLLIGADLRGVAHLYLPSIGFCLLLGGAIDGLSVSRAKIAAGAALLLFQSAATWHNIRIWDRTAHVADEVCRMAAREAAHSSRPPVFENPPLILDGIAFFTNGLPECVAMHAPGASISVSFFPDLPAPPAGTPVFVWDDRARRFVPK